MPKFHLNGNKLVQQDGNGVWTLDGQIEYDLLPPLICPRFPVRMVLLQLADNNSFVVWSPFPPQSDVLQELASLPSSLLSSSSGRDVLKCITHVVAPNSLHWLWALEFTEFLRDHNKHHGTVKLYVAPGLPHKTECQKAGLCLKKNETAILPNDEEWNEHTGRNDVLVAKYIPGIPQLEEVVLWHKPSKTLLVADMAFHFQKPSTKKIDNYGGSSDDSSCWNATWPVTWYLQLADGYRPCCLTRTFKYLVKDVESCHRAMQEVVTEWDFDRLIVAHGKIIDTNAKAMLKQGTLSLLEEWMDQERSAAAAKSNGIFAVGTATVAAILVVIASALINSKRSQR
jgi:hypothetical protein